MEREHTLKQVLKTRFCFHYFTCYSGNDTQRSQEFIPKLSFRKFQMVQILNDCDVRDLNTVESPLLIDHLPKSNQ